MPAATAAAAAAEVVLRRFLLVLAVATSRCAILTAATAEVNATSSGDFQLGVLGPFTSISQGFLGVAAAFDIDLRKNFEPDLRGRFGSPVVHIPNIHPALEQLQLRFATSHSQGAVAIEAVWDWITSSDLPPVRGFVGEFFSSISGPVASVAGTRSVPQVSWASTSPALSNKDTYPFFSRTVASDSVQGAAMWTWMVQFAVPAVAVVYTAEAYGEGLFQVILSLAAEAGRADRVHGVPVPAWDVTLSASFDAVAQVRATGTKFIMLAPADNGIYFMQAMEQEGLLYGNAAYQIVGAESVLIESDSGVAVSGGWPIGLHRFMPVSRGSLFSNFTQLWNRMTPDDIYGAEASQRYGWDSLSVPLADAVTAELVQADFDDISALDTAPLAPFLFDALYAFAMAFNTLLNSGVPLESVRGQMLLEAVRAASFEGITGSVVFDESGDRVASYDFQHAVYLDRDFGSNATGMRRVGGFKDGVLTLSAAPVWAPAGQARSTSPPEVLLECAFGFERETTTNLCLPCGAGVGCGFREEDGIPIGVAFPMTSITQSFLPIVLAFYKDLQKNMNPGLLGNPVVEIPNVNPALKLKLQVGTSHSSVSVGMNTALDWLLGSGDLSKVAGLVFGFHSNIAVPVASIAGGFQTPMLGFASTSPTLSDKGQYGYFLRTVAPDSLQGRAMWKWARWFSVPSVAFFYTQNAYGEGLFQTVIQEASEDELADTVRGVSVRAHTGEPDFGAIREACTFIRQLGSPFIMMGMITTQITPVLYIMEQENMLYGDSAYQLLGTESAFIDTNMEYVPSLGLPVGFQKFLPGTEGRLFQSFLAQWSNLTAEEVYSDETRKEFALDYLRVPLSEAASPVLTDADFALPPFAPFLLPLLFDALYTYAIAINNLLNSGLAPRDVYGQILLKELNRTSFEGISGKVAFNADGDRFAIYKLLNYQPAQASSTSSELEEVHVGDFDASIGSFIPLGGEAGDPLELVWAQGHRGTSAPDALLACPAGTAFDAGLRRCAKCPTGFFSPGGKEVECSACEAGFTSNDAATGCEPCPPGTYAEFGGRSCTACAAGSFAGANGSSVCELCSIGRYSASSRATECSRCGEGRATMQEFTTMTRFSVEGLTQYQYIVGSDSPDLCGCDTGRRQDEDGECRICTEGMVCPGLDSIFIESGYYSNALPHLSIYKCWGDDKRCVGGDPGATCAPGRRSITCSECIDGMTPAAGGACTPCSGEDKAPFFVVMLSVLVVLVLLYVVTTTRHGKSQSLSLVLCAVASGQLVTTMQQVGVVGRLALQWEEPLKGLIAFASLLALNIEVLRLNCVGTVSPTERYALKLMMILSAVVVLGIVHVVVVFFFRQRQFRKHGWSFISAVTALLLVFYITVAGISLEPLQCKSHPNGKWTVWHYQSVVCWQSSEHISMLIPGFIALLSIPVGFLVAVLSAVLQFPARLQAADAKFIRAFAFLFFRFQPGKQWFLVALLAKGLLLASCLVIPDILVETIALQGILLASFCISLVVQPWRVLPANILDAALGIAMLVMVVFASFFIEDGDKNLRLLSWLSFAALSGGLCLIFIAVFYGLWRKYVRRVKPFAFFLCHHKAASGAYCRLLKLYLLELPRLRGDVFVDSDNLDNLDHLYDFVRSDTETLVVVSTTDIFTRPWCVGEMTTARIKQVWTLLLATPTCKLPDKEMIANIEAEGFPSMETLVESGIDIEMIQETLQWASSLPAIHVPQLINRSMMHKVAEKIFARQADASLLIVALDPGAGGGMSGSVAPTNTPGGGNSPNTRGETKHAFLMYDTNNMEACASCHVLQKMLVPIMGHNTDLIPDVVSDDSDLPISTQPGATKHSVLLVVCTNGVLSNQTCLRMLGKMTLVPGMFSPIPVLAETSFRFPPQDVAGWLASQSLVDFTEEMVAEASHGVTLLFKHIAAHFEPQHASGAVLLVSARQLQERILRDRQAMQRAGAPHSSAVPSSTEEEHSPGLSPKNMASTLARRGMKSGRSRVAAGGSTTSSPSFTPVCSQSGPTDSNGGLPKVSKEISVKSSASSVPSNTVSAVSVERLPPIAQAASALSRESTPGAAAAAPAAAVQATSVDHNVVIAGEDPLIDLDDDDEEDGAAAEGDAGQSVSPDALQFVMVC